MHDPSHALGMLLVLRALAPAAAQLPPRRPRPRRRRPPAPASASAAADPGEGPRLALSPDGVHIEYRVFGHGDPAVILVHGWACDANYWNEQLEALKAHYTVVAVNLAGHGGSGSNRTDWSIANYAGDVAAVAARGPGRAPGAGRARDGRDAWRWRRRRSSGRASSASSRSMRCARSGSRRCRRRRSRGAWRRSAPTSSARRAAS